MLRSIQSLIGFTIGATDGEIGKVKDFYFDNQTWKIRYLIVETGNWLFGRKVLLSPVSVQTGNWDTKIFPVNLTKEQIKNSPDIDTDKPVSVQQEEELHSHYSWPYDPGAGMGYMTTGMVGGIIAPDIPLEERVVNDVNNEGRIASNRAHTELKGDRNLRSFKNLIGYSIHATDDDLREIDDLLLDDTSWNIPFAVIETGTWYSGKKILCPTSSITNIEWLNTSVYVNQSTHSLKNMPNFDYDQLNSKDFNGTVYQGSQNTL